jgi:CrcB protein
LLFFSVPLCLCGEDYFVFEAGWAAMIVDYLSIAAGGALGAAMRYLAALLIAPTPGSLPWPTLAVNVLGSFVLGYFSRAGTLGHRQLLFVAVGFLGSLTTFSTLAFEIVQRYQSGLVALAISYLLLTFGLGSAAAWIGAEIALRFNGANR